MAFKSQRLQSVFIVDCTKRVCYQVHSKMSLQLYCYSEYFKNEGLVINSNMFFSFFFFK